MPCCSQQRSRSATGKQTLLGHRIDAASSLETYPGLETATIQERKASDKQTRPSQKAAGTQQMSLPRTMRPRKIFVAPS